MQPPVIGNVLDLQASATAVAQEVIASIRPDQLTAPTPCSEWDVRGILNHLISFHRIVAAAGVDEELPGWNADVVGDDPAADFATASGRAHDALSAPGALDRTYALPWGEAPGRMLATLLFMDTLIHAWDLAKATGRPTTLDARLCETALATGRAMMRDEFREPGRGFGPEVTVAADARACDRLAAFYGRRP